VTCRQSQGSATSTSPLPTQIEAQSGGDGLHLPIYETQEAKGASGASPQSSAGDHQRQASVALPLHEQSASEVAIAVTSELYDATVARWRCAQPGVWPDGSTSTGIQGFALEHG